MKLKIASWTEDDFISLPRGTYIRTTHGEGKVGDKLPTGSRIVKTVDKVERKLSYDDVIAIWDKNSKAWKKVEANMKLKKADMLIISPRSLIQRALLIGVITPEEANSRAIKDAAQEEAEFVTDTWTEGEGIGSSDMNAFTYSMLQIAGIQVDWTTGRMIRKDKVAAFDYDFHKLNQKVEDLIRDFYSPLAARKFAEGIGDTEMLIRLARSAQAIGVMRGKPEKGSAVQKILMDQARIEESKKVGSITAAVRPENIRMIEFLVKHGIKCQVKYIWNGSLRGTWRLYGKGQAWTPELMRKLTDLRFKGFDGRQLDEYSGNGGAFSVFVRGHNELLEDASGAGEPDVEKTMMAKTAYVFTKSGYTPVINEVLRAMKRTDIKPELVDGYLRLDHGTLDGLSMEQFRREIPSIVGTIDDDPEAAERNARSYGLQASSEVFMSAINVELDGIMASVGVKMNETKIADRVAGRVIANLPRWHNVTSMRKDIEAMAEQIAMQLAE